MNIWNKVLLVLIAIMLLPLFYFSMVALKTHQHWRTAAKKIEKRLPEIEREIEVLEFGDPAKDGGECLQSVRIELYKYLVNRGRVWRKCVLQAQEGNQVRVALEKPDPHGIFPHMILFAFDEAPMQRGGRFLGEFKVKEVTKDHDVITLEPTMRLSPKAIERIKSGQARWTLREAMPNDMHEVFAGMKPDQLRTLLPGEVVDEYLTDGKDGKVRELRDYYVLLKELDRQETVLREELESATRHEQYMKEAAADAKKQELFRQEERTALTAELNRMKKERKAALAYEQSLEHELAGLEAKIAQLIQDNRAVAAEIAKMQSKMIRQVDRRAAVAAQ